MFLAVPALCAAQGRPCDPPSPTGPSHDLYCIELVPAPGVIGVSGRVELAHPGGPFTVAVTPDGRSRFTPIFFLSGLTPAGVHIAWIAPPTLDTVIKLGAVHNGRAALRPKVTPYLPVADSPIPDAQSHEVLHLNDGDMIDLDAELVRRAINGRTYTMYSYNGQYPGPLIEVARGSEIKVRFTNHLPDSTSIHWHGVRLDNRFDGVDGVSDAFTYAVRFPDAGIYWYHPHIREGIQQALGLYGNILVREPRVTVPANREEILMLQDLLVGDSGLIPFAQASP